MEKKKSKTYWRRRSMPWFIHQQPTDRGNVGNITHRELIRQINSLAVNNLCHWLLPYYQMTIVPDCFFIICIWIFWLWKWSKVKKPVFVLVPSGSYPYFSFVQYGKPILQYNGQLIIHTRVQKELGSKYKVFAAKL